MLTICKNYVTKTKISKRYGKINGKGKEIKKEIHYDFKIEILSKFLTETQFSH
mgnify:CR=1 FL=1